MNKRSYYLLMVMLFATLGMTARAQTVTIGDVEAGPGPVNVPVYMEDFTDVDGFQLAFSFDPQLITGFEGIENRFITGPNIIWAPQSNVAAGQVVVTFMDFDLNTYDIDEKVFDLKFMYAGGHDAHIEFNLDNTDIMVNGVIMDNDDITFIPGSIITDPDLLAGTVSMETVTDVAPDQEVMMPINMSGDGFANIEVVDLTINFDPGQLIYEEVVLNEDLDFDAVTTELQDDGELRIMLTSQTGIDLSDVNLANIRFTYTAVTEAPVTFKPGGEIASPAGELAFETEDGLFVPAEFDVTLNVPDVFQYSGANVEIPVEIHGEFPSNVGSVSLRIGYDTDIMVYAGYESIYSENWTIGGTDPLILELVIFDEEGIELVDGTDLITLRFDFVDIGTSEVEIRDGSSIKTPIGVTLPFTPDNGSAGVAVSAAVYEALLDARENTFLDVSNPETNHLEAVTTYPDEFLEFIEEDGFTIPALTEDWMVDAQFMSEEPIPAGTEIMITYGDHEFSLMVEEEIPAETTHFLSEMILSADPDADVRTALFDHAGKVETWNVDIRSPITYETILHFAVVTDDDDFTVVEDDEAWWNGFNLADDMVEMTVYGEPQILFAINGVPVATGFEEVLCSNDDLEVTLHEVVVGEEPLTIVYTVNGEEFTAEDVSTGDVLFPSEDHPDIDPGTYDIVVTSIIDAVGVDVIDPEDTYYGTVIIHAEPAVLFAFNGEIAETGSHFEFCFDEEVVVTLEEIVAGEGPINLLYLLNNDGPPVAIDGIEEGDELFADVLPVGHHTLHLIMLEDANGCQADDVETIYSLEITVHPEPAVLFSFNDEIAETGSHFEFCFDEVVEITLHEILSGEGPINLHYVLNDDEPVAIEDIEEGDVLYNDVLPVGHHTLHLAMLEDANGCQADDVETIYSLEITVHPEPAVLFSFNDEIVETGSELYFLDDEEVTVKLHEIVHGTGPIEFMYVLNDDDPVHVEDADEGDILFEGTLPVGEHTLHLTMLRDAAGCEVIDPQDIYTLTIEVEESIVDVETLAELRDMPDDGTVYRFTGEASIVAMDGFRNRKFIQDETAAILIDDQPGIITTEYDLYDVMTDVVGKLNIWNNMLRFQPEEDAPPAVDNQPIEPTIFPMDMVTPDDQAKLITLQDVMFIDIDDGEEFVNGTNYTITDGVNEFVVRTDFWDVDYIGTEIPTLPLDITGVITQFQDDLQLIPRFADDFDVSHVAGFPFFDDFEDTDTHAHWSKIDLAGDGFVWVIDDNDRFDVEEPMEGYFAVIDSDDAGSGNDVWSALQAPIIDLSDFDGGDISLTFDHHYRQIGATEGMVLVSKDMATWDTLAVYTENQGFSTGFSPPFEVTPVSESLIIQGFEPGDHLYLRFEYNDQGTWGWYWLIDNIALDYAVADLEVTFHVLEDSADEDPIENATITINGEHTLTTDANGMAMIDLPPGEYSAEVTAAGYVTEDIMFEVADEDLTVTVHMVDDIEEPFNLQVTTEGFDHGDALFTWDHDAVNDKVFVGFDVFLNDDMVDDGITVTEYMFTGLPAGEHTAGVRAVYTTGMSDIITIDFEIEMMTYTVMFNVFDEFGDDIDDAIITFDGVTYDPGHYVFEDVMPGLYEYTVERDEYFPVVGEVNVVDEDVVVDVEMLVDDTSVIDPDEIELSVYPVPAHSTLHIESNTNITDLRVVDMLGQVVYSATVNDLRHDINVSDFKNGVYFLQMTTTAGVITHRMQVAR